MIQLVGPGGAGKSTLGLALAEHLGVAFMDLDEAFIALNGDISAFIGEHGYPAYARENLDTYLARLTTPDAPGVAALSSAFMTYSKDLHPQYRAIHQRIACSAETFVLLPTLDLETCVREIVRRQLQRPFARTAEREESVIRSRFSLYAELPARKMLTQKPICAVLDEVLALLPDRARQQPLVTAAEAGRRNTSQARGTPQKHFPALRHSGYFFSPEALILTTPGPMTTLALLTEHEPGTWHYVQGGQQSGRGRCAFAGEDL